MMDKALRTEACEQTLRHALFQVQMDGVFGEHARVLEDDRPDRRLAAPVGELLVLLPGRAESVEGSGPARIGPGRSVERREVPYRVALVVPTIKVMSSRSRKVLFTGSLEKPVIEPV